MKKLKLTFETARRELTREEMKRIMAGSTGGCKAVGDVCGFGVPLYRCCEGSCLFIDHGWKCYL